MKIKKLLKLAICAGVLSWATSAQVASAVTCPEMVNNVISHSSGYVYFTSSRTCANWCMIAGKPEYITQTYALLLVAQSKKRQVQLAWTSLDSCDQQNALYAIPDYVIITPP